MKTDVLSALENKYPYFKVITDYNVKQWILTCEVIVTWLSTAAIEAFFADKACFILRPVEYPYAKDLCLYRNASYIKTKEEFMNILSVNCENSLDRDYVHQCYDVRKSEPSYVRLADQLEEIYQSRERFPWDDEVIRRFNRTDRLRYIKRSALYIIKAKIANIILRLSKVVHLSFGEKINQILMTYDYNYKKMHSRKDSLVTEIEAALAPKVRRAYKIRTGNQPKNQNANKVVN